MLWLFFALQTAHAEYRVFELVITNPTTGQERVLKSTLTPAQYRGYHALSLEEQVTYQATWMCKGNTGNRRPLCPNPKDQDDAPSRP